MSSSAVLSSIRHLRGLLAARDESDEQLLHLFLHRRDDSAFAALVRRHGPMVLHVCRRVLGHQQDAEDAFQATFLVLAQQATRLRKKSSLVSFLHGTAYRTAMKAKQSAARRRKYEGQSPTRSPDDPAEEISWREVRTLLDEEIAGLPEIYRSVLILCGLENVSQTEAARRLGLNVRTASHRLAEARKRLAQRLARRGVELTALLATVTLAASTSSALPIGLIASTTKTAMAIALSQATASAISAPVAELMQGAAPAMGLSKAKLAAAMLLIVAASGSLVSWYRQASRPLAAVPQSPAAKATEQSRTQTPVRERRQSVEIAGRVLDPDGNPVKGARLYWPRLLQSEPKSPDDIEMPQRATTDADGRFRSELPRSDIKPEWRFVLLAVAEGYGVSWAAWSAVKAGGEITLRMVKDQPIAGRIVSAEGKPLTGVRVSIAELGGPASHAELDLFVSAWKRHWRSAEYQNIHYRNGQLRAFLPLDKILKPATTDKDGRFRVTGAGAERLVVLRMRGSNVVPQRLYVVNRAGFDAAAVNKTVFGQAPPLYGPALTYTAPPSRSITGVVREADSGKPVAGYRISIFVGNDAAISAVSDKEGRYRLNGVPKMKHYLLSAAPPANSSWLSTGARCNDRAGTQPLTVDVTVARGIRLSGRVLEKSTGRGVAGGIRFAPLPGNPVAGKPGYDSHEYGSGLSEVAADGRFALTILPGRGVLLFEAEKLRNGQLLNPYQQAELSDKDRKNIRVIPNDDGGRRIATLGNSIEDLNGLNAVKYLDLAADTRTAQCDLFVDRGLTMAVKLEDADGKAVKGTTVAGVTAVWPIAYPVAEPSFTAYALDPKKPRRLLFLHAERKLAGSLKVRGDEKGPLTARLVPTATVSGRLLDRDGRALSGAVIELNPLDSTARGLYHQVGQHRPPIRTGKDGRFRFEGVIPDLKFILSIRHGRTLLIDEPRIGLRQIQSGATLDLGDIRVKTGP